MPRIKSAAPLIVALLLAGCGSTTPTTATPASAGGHSTGGGAPVAPDRSSYIAKADALCTAANARQATLRRRAKGLAVTKLVPILHQQAAVAESLAHDLGKLTAPTTDRAAVGRFVRSVHQLAVYSKAVAGAIGANHAYAARSLAAKLRLARTQESLLGQGYGYRVCASGKSY